MGNFFRSHTFTFAMGIFVLVGCSPSNYRFTKEFVSPQLDCAALACPLPDAKACRFSDAPKSVSGCPTACGTLRCDNPAAPTLTSLEQVLNSTNLTWEPVKAVGTVRYRVVRSVASLDDVKSDATDPKSTDASLVFGKEHSYSVVAVSEWGESKPSSPLAIIPIEPFTIRKGSVGNATATIQWNSVKGAASYSVLHGKSVDALAEEAVSVSESGGIASATISGLPNGAAHYFQVVAKNPKVRRPSDNVISLFPYDGFSMIARSARNQSAKVGWSPLVGASLYRLDYWSVSDPSKKTTLSDIAGTEREVSGLTNGTLYEFRACGLLGGDCIATANSIRAQPIAPAPITAIDGYKERIDVSWNGVAGGTEYQVFYRKKGDSVDLAGPNERNASLSLGKEPIAVAPAGTTFEFRVSSINGEGGVESSPYRDGTPLGALTILTFELKNGEIDLTWSAAAGADHYEVYYTVAGTIRSISTDNRLSAALNGLANGSPFEVFVRASRSGQGGYVDSDKRAGTPHGGFRMLAATPGLQKVDSSWGALAGAAAYELKFREAADASGNWQSGGSQSGLTKTVESLKAGVSYEFRADARLGDGSIIPADNSLLATPIAPDPIKRFKPALAVRGIQCLLCHAHIGSNIVTDLGAGSDNFLPKAAHGELYNRNYFTTSPDSAYTNQRDAFQSANAIDGQVIVPKYTLDQDAIRFLWDDGRASAKVSMSLKDVFTDGSGLTGNGSMLDKVNPPSGVDKIVEKSKVLIQYPTRDEILNLIPVEARRDGAVYAASTEFSRTSSITGLKAVAGGVVTNESESSEIECHGDVVIQGTLVLENAKVKTDSKGCRLYVTDSVFIQGEIPLTSTESGKKPNLQIASARSIIMGISYIGMSGLDATDAHTPSERPDVNGRLAEGGHSRFATRMNFQYNPSGGAINGVPGNDFFTGITEEARIVERVAGLRLIDAGDSNFVQRGATFAGAQVVDSSVGFHLSANFEGILLNAPHVHSRYFGNFKGVIIAEVAFLARNVGNVSDEKFFYDSVFDDAPLMLPLLPRVPLVIED